MKVGIVSPFSWAFIGGVGEHAECQAAALEELGVEAKVLTGDDPHGRLSYMFHSEARRVDKRPDRIIPLGTSVVVPANHSLPHIVLSPLSVLRLRRAFQRENFDLIHVHEPMTPAICVAALALAPCPVVGTWHATGELNWLKGAMPLWGFLIDRIEHRIAVSEIARNSASRYLPADYEILPNAITIPPNADPADRENTVVFIGRNDPRKGTEVLLRAWPEVHRRTGARLHMIGADPQAIQALMGRERLSDEGVDLLGVVVGDPLTDELLRAKLLVAPSIEGESFGMVLTRAFACATPVVASDIPGYDKVMTPDVGLTVPPKDPVALGVAMISLLEDEPRRRTLGANARELAVEKYGWNRLARRLVQIYENVLASPGPPARSVTP